MKPWQKRFFRTPPTMMVGLAILFAAFIPATMGSVIQNVAGGDLQNIAEAVRRVCMFVLLGGFLTLLYGIVQQRTQSGFDVKIVDRPPRCWISPIKKIHYVSVLPSSDIAQALKAVSYRRRHRAKILNLKGCKLDSQSIEMISLFPNLVAIDFQNCELDIEDMDDLESLTQLRLVLLAGSSVVDVEPNRLRSLFPQAQRFTQERLFGFIDVDVGHQELEQIIASNEKRIAANEPSLEQS